MGDDGRSGARIPRRRVLAGLAALAASPPLGGCGRAVTQDRTTPSGPASCRDVSGQRVRWIVPNAPGGGFDAEARLVGSYLAGEIGAEVSVENVPGAGGIVGANTIRSAAGDGLTIGILGVPGLLAASLTGETAAPNPARDFAIVGRISRSWHVWAVAARSPYRTVDELLALGRPLLFAITEVSSASFVSVAASSHLLSAPVELVAGFEGTRAASLAAVRGEVDCVCFNFETIADMIEEGDLRPVLQVSVDPISDNPSLAFAPRLGGPGGLAVARARTTGADPEAARDAAEVLTRFVGAGRVVVAPLVTAPDRLACLDEGLSRALANPTLQATAPNPVDAARGAEARAGIEAAEASSGTLLPVIRDAVARLRG